jgi:hypothetical protein
MPRIILIFVTVASFALTAKGQPDLSYYMPEGVTFHPSVPTPKSVIGHEVVSGT